MPTTTIADEYSKYQHCREMLKAYANSPKDKFATPVCPIQGVRCVEARLMGKVINEQKENHTREIDTLRRRITELESQLIQQASHLTEKTKTIESLQIQLQQSIDESDSHRRLLEASQPPNKKQKMSLRSKHTKK